MRHTPGQQRRPTYRASQLRNRVNNLDVDGFMGSWITRRRFGAHHCLGVPGYVTWAIVPQVTNLSWDIGADPRIPARTSPKGHRDTP